MDNYSTIPNKPTQNFNDLFLNSYKPESQNFLDQGLIYDWSNRACLVDQLEDGKKGCIQTN